MAFSPEKSNLGVQDLVEDNTTQGPYDLVAII